MIPDVDRKCLNVIFRYITGKAGKRNVLTGFDQSDHIRIRGFYPAVSVALSGLFSGIDMNCLVVAALAYTMPHSKEVAILCVADKLAAVYDIWIVPLRRIVQEIRRQ